MQDIFHGVLTMVRLKEDYEHLELERNSLDSAMQYVPS